MPELSSPKSLVTKPESVVRVLKEERPSTPPKIKSMMIRSSRAPSRSSMLTLFPESVKLTCSRMMVASSCSRILKVRAPLSQYKIRIMIRKLYILFLPKSFIYDDFFWKNTKDCGWISYPPTAL